MVATAVILNIDVIILKRCYGCWIKQKMAEGLVTFMLNLILTCRGYLM